MLLSNLIIVSKLQLNWTKISTAIHSSFVKKTDIIYKKLFSVAKYLAL